MDISKKKSRTQLGEYFRKNSIPTAENFAELIGSALNQHDDGIAKPIADALCIEASRQDHKPVLNLYENFQDPNPSWVLSLADFKRNRGFAIVNGVSDQNPGVSRIFIEHGTGNVGIGIVTPAEKLDVNGGIKALSANFIGLTTVGGELRVTGTVSLSHALAIAGNVTAGGSLDVTGAVTASQTLAVTGAVTARSSVDVSGTMTVAGATTTNQTLTVGGAITARSTLDVASKITAGAALDVTGDVMARANLTTVGNVTTSGTLDVTKAVTARNALSVTGPITANSTLNVADKLTAAAALDVTGAVTARSSLSVTGNMTASGSLDVTGPMSAAASIDIGRASRPRPADHPTGRPLYVTGDLVDKRGVEFRTSNAALGIGIDATSIYAAGANATQDIEIVPKGTAEAPGVLRIKAQCLVDSIAPQSTQPNAELKLAGKGTSPVRVTTALRADANVDVTGTLTVAAAKVTGALTGVDAEFSGSLRMASMSVTNGIRTTNVTATGAVTAGSLEVTGLVNAAGCIDIGRSNRTKPNDHPIGRPLYVSGDILEQHGVEFRTSDATLGIGIDGTSVYAAGTKLVQDIDIMPKGGGVVRLKGQCLVDSIAPQSSQPTADLMLAAKGAGARVRVTSDLRTDGTVTMTGAVTASSTLDVTGALTTSATLGVTGAAKVGSLASNTTISAAGAITGSSMTATNNIAGNSLTIGNSGVSATSIVGKLPAETSATNALATAQAIVDYVNKVAPSITHDLTSGDNARLASGKAVVDFVNHTVPIGTIVMWSNFRGKEIPAGWELCNGDNGKPDLRNRFVYGSPSANTGNGGIGGTGGEAYVTLSVDQIPAHSHAVTVNHGGDHSHSFQYMQDKFKREGDYTESNLNMRFSDLARVDVSTTSSGRHDHGTFCANTGGGQAHNNMPPYYVLAFIIRVS